MKAKGQKGLIKIILIATQSCRRTRMKKGLEACMHIIRAAEKSRPKNRTNNSEFFLPLFRQLNLESETAF